MCMCCVCVCVFCVCVCIHKNGVRKRESVCVRMCICANGMKMRAHSVCVVLHSLPHRCHLPCPCFFQSVLQQVLRCNRSIAKCRFQNHGAAILSKRSLSSVPSFVFEFACFLRRLDLSGNELEWLDPNLGALTQLEWLDVEHNHIVDLTPVCSLEKLRVGHTGHL
jgi:Leucine Rich Repeat